MRLGRVWSILFCFIFLCNLVSYPQVSKGQEVVSLIGLDLNGHRQIGFIFSRDKVDKDYLKAYPLKYFFTTLVVPNDELWVNLSPRLGDTEIIGEGISNTDLGRLMLYYDLKLKHDVEKLLKIYGDEIDEYMENLGKDVNLRFWIEPGIVEIEVDRGKGVIRSAPLEVRVEVNGRAGERFKNWLEKKLVPILKDRVNRGEGYARLRQAYNSMILAQWYKRHIRKGMVFSEYVDSKAKGEGIVSDGVWFRSAYLEEYVRMYLGEDSKDGPGASFVVGGVRGEIEKVKEVPGNIRYGSTVHASDGNKVISKIDRTIREVEEWDKSTKVNMDVEKLNEVIDEFLKVWYDQDVRISHDDESISALWNEYMNKPVIHQRCEIENRWGEITDGFEIIPSKGELLVIGKIYSLENLMKILEVFRDRLKKGKDIKLVFFVPPSWIGRYCKDRIIPVPLYVFFDLYKEMPDRIILLGERRWKKIRQYKDDLAVALQTLPYFAVVGENRILIDGGIAEMRQDLKVGDMGKGQLSNYLEIDNYVLISFYDRKFKIRYPALNERIYGKTAEISKMTQGGLRRIKWSQKSFSSRNEKIRFEDGSLERIIDVLNGKVKDTHTYLLIDRDNNGDVLVSLYDLNRSYTVGPNSAVVEVNQQGISPGFLYAQTTNLIKKTLFPLSANTWRILPIVYEAIDKEMRRRFYWDKERMVKDIKIDGVQEVWLRGMKEDVFEREVKNILNYKGSQDLYIWVYKKRGSIDECVLRVQSSRPLFYRGAERKWALLRLNHLNGQIEIVKKGELKDRVIYRVVGGIKKAFIKSRLPLGRYMHITFRRRVSKNTWSVGREFFLGKRERVKLYSEGVRALLSRRENEAVLSILARTSKKNSVVVSKVVKIPESQKVFLDSRFNKVQSLSNASFVIEAGRDGFVRIVTLSKKGLLMSTHAQVDLVDIKDNGGCIVGYEDEKKNIIQRVIVEYRSSKVVMRKKDETIEIGRPKEGDIVLLDANFNPTDNKSRARFKLLFKDNGVSIRPGKGKIWVPIIHIRDITYKDRSEYYTVLSYKSNTNRKFYIGIISLFDGCIMTKGTEEYIVIDWNRDDELKRLYEDVVKKLIQILKENSGLALSSVELERLKNALIRVDRTEVQEFMAKVMSSRVKSQLIRYVYEAIKKKVKYGNVNRDDGELFFIGDSIDAKGVCRHTAILTGAILERLTQAGFLLGKTYWIGIPGHAFILYITSRGIPIVMDIAQNGFSPVTINFRKTVTGSFSEEEPFDIEYKWVIKKMGVWIPRSIESRIDNGVSAWISGLTSGQVGNKMAFVSFEPVLDGQGEANYLLQVQDIDSRQVISIRAREEDGNRVKQFLETLGRERSSLAKLLLRNWSEVSQKLRFYVIEDQGKDKRRFKDFFGWGGDGKVVVSSALLERIDSEKTKGLLWLHEILEALVSMGIAEIGVDGENVYMKMGAERLEFKASKEQLKQLLFEKLLPGKGGVAHYLIYELEKEDIGNVSRDLTKTIRQEKRERGVRDNDKWWRKNIEVLDRGVPEVVKNVLYDRFSSGRWSEGAVLDVVRYLYGQENAGISEEGVGDWGKMKGDIVERVDKVLGEKARDEFLRTWEKIDTDTRLDVAKKTFRVLSLMHEYKIYAISPVIYENVLKQAGEIFKKWVNSGDVNKIRESMDDLAWYSKGKVGMMGRKDVGKGGLVLSLKSLILS